jgi:hypothetical protein
LAKYNVTLSITQARTVAVEADKRSHAAEEARRWAQAVFSMDDSTRVAVRKVRRVEQMQLEAEA